MSPQEEAEAALVRAFVQGAQWWAFFQLGSMTAGGDRSKGEALRRFARRHAGEAAGGVGGRTFSGRLKTMPISGTITMCQMDEETYNRGAAKSEPASCELGLTEGGEYCRGTPCRSCTALVEEPVGVDALFRRLSEIEGNLRLQMERAEDRDASYVSMTLGELLKLANLCRDAGFALKYR